MSINVITHVIYTHLDQLKKIGAAHYQDIKYSNYDLSRINEITN